MRIRVIEWRFLDYLERILVNLPRSLTILFAPVGSPIDLSRSFTLEKVTKKVNLLNTFLRTNNYGIRMYHIVTSCNVHASRTYFFSYEAHEYRFISDIS